MRAEAEGRAGDAHGEAVFWSHKHRLFYWTDIDYDAATGSLSRRRAVAKCADPGAPDGSCVDAEGFVWSAVWEVYRVARHAPDDRLDRLVDAPVRKPSCCAFSGADLATLYITTSRQGESAERRAAEPLAGSLFSMQPGVVGLADAPFAG